MLSAIFLKSYLDSFMFGHATETRYTQYPAC